MLKSTNIRTHKVIEKALSWINKKTIPGWNSMPWNITILSQSPTKTRKEWQPLTHCLTRWDDGRDYSGVISRRYHIILEHLFCFKTIEFMVCWWPRAHKKDPFELSCLIWRRRSLGTCRSTKFLDTEFRSLALWIWTIVLEFQDIPSSWTTPYSFKSICDVITFEF